MAAPTPFLFPATQPTILPDPSTFFSSNLSSPLPTNSFFQNFVLNSGEQPEYIHPYLVKSTKNSLSIAYPLLLFTASVFYQTFAPDLTISSATPQESAAKNHVISSYSDLGVTLDIPSSNLRFFLVRGSPYITASVTKPTTLSIKTTSPIESLNPSKDNTKYILKLKSGQTWIIYSSSAISLTKGETEISSNSFSGIIRFASLRNPQQESTLDKYSSSYPVSGYAVFNKSFNVVYNLEKEGNGDLLLLAHPLHVKLLSSKSNKVTVLSDFKYPSVDGELVGVVGDSWELETKHVPLTWNSVKGVKKEAYEEIVKALVNDVNELNSSNVTTSSSYFYGKLVARAARLALIAEEVSNSEVIPKITKFLKDTIQPWLDGSFKGNSFLYEKKWGGLVTKQGSTDKGADFGFGVYNDHHYHLGYFIYGIAVLAKIDTAWGQKYKPQAYALVSDFLNTDLKSNSHYPLLRNFDVYKLHSWASGLTEFADGRNQESTSEAVNAYYAAALMGVAYHDMDLVRIASTVTALEIHAAQTWWHVKSGDKLYAEEFAKGNKIVGIVWSNKRDSSLWWASAEAKECRLSIQVLPLSPITEALFSDAAYVKELVEWTLPSLNKPNIEGWKGFTYALQGIYDKSSSLEKIRALKGVDDGNSFTNLLWWIHSR
ncbi:hypothetical protein TanjilG_22433 [Lupinus angustifolius]|uniref:glucan endo-1,3-beta-D-glucosidase n=1 Tax=Lupinus angustifolius TaxID=3871 RepID=A0A4P1RSQ2_LUPAN|nr:PREDICTED: probable endo-1,3(4)-beta-glucanase ARB_01444 [Lupinus angustifolius]OIW17321.1 hypothetical protein TanjilG_22433 [Lupinus angustifolius]